MAKATQSPQSVTVEIALLRLQDAASIKLAHAIAVLNMTANQAEEYEICHTITDCVYAALSFARDAKQIVDQEFDALRKSLSEGGA